MEQMPMVGKLGLAAAGYLCLVAASCPSAPGAAKPTMVQITGFGKWDKPTATTPDRFRFAVRAEETCAPGTGLCSQKFPDTAFVDFSIPSRTTFEVKSGTEPLGEVAQTAPLGDYQYRRAFLRDNPDSTTTWRIAVSVPSMIRMPAAAAVPRKFCSPTVFPIEILDVSGTSKSDFLPLALVWGKCPSDTTVGFYSTGKPGTPQMTSPPTPAGDCPGGTFAKAFEVCEFCGSSGLSTAKTFWGCDLADARNDFGLPGCTATLKTGTNCP